MVSLTIYWGTQTCLRENAATWPDLAGQTLAEGEETEVANSLVATAMS